MKYKKSMTVGRSLGLGFGVMLVAMAIMLAAAFHGLTSSQAALQTIYQDRTLPLQQLAGVRYLAMRNRIVLTDAVMHGNADTTAKRLEQHEKNKAAAGLLWTAYMATYLTPEEKILADRTQNTLAALDSEGFEATATALRAGRYDDARKVLDTRVSPLSPVFVEAMDALLALQVSVAAAEFESAKATGRNAMLMMTVVAALGGLAGLAAAVLITQRLTRRLGAEPDALAEAAERIAGGNLAAAQGKAAPSGSVMASMEAMRAALQRVVGGVRQGVEQVATASAQIAQGNLDLSGRTEQQASSLQETAASMEQLTGTVRASADNARQASQLAQGASEVAERGGSAVMQVVATMGEIEAASRKIADITGVIDSIAFQTNILALNAAVEAARAGEQGRGFAVVATEVRTLAQRSADAARQIKDLIGDSVQRVAAGSTLAQDAGATMNDIVAQVRSVSVLISEITQAAGEQSQGIAQVGQAVSLLDQATQQNAALVEESAAAAASLKELAQQLTASVAVFSLEPAVQA
jgi:methyl-accepting chemotaxis protein